MGETVRLASGEDGFEYEAWRETPTDARRGGLILLHAIWGVTPHLRDMAAAYADQGYETLVPSLFDRFQRGFAPADVDETARERQTGFAERTGWGLDVLDAVQAAVDALKPPVFAVGFCFGGTTAWLAAARCSGLSAAAAFYGGAIAGRYLAETPRIPTALHFGRNDALIPPADVAAIREMHPETPVHLYDAGHAFMAPSDFHADSARLAQLRVLQLFALNGGGRGDV